MVKKDDIEKKIKEFSQKAEPILSRGESLANLEKYGEDLKKRKDKIGDVLSVKDRKFVDNKVQDVLDWIEDHPDAKKEDIEKQKKLLGENVEPVLSKAEAISSLKDSAEDSKNRKENLGSFLTPKEKKSIDNKIEEVLDWIEDHPDSKVDDIKKKEKELLDKLEPIFQRAEALELLNDYGKEIDRKTDANAEFLTPKEVKTLKGLRDAVEDWVHDHPDASRDEILKKKKEIKDKAEPIFFNVQKHYQIWKNPFKILKINLTIFQIH